VPKPLVLIRRDQSHGPEHLRGERLIRVVAQVGGREFHAREVEGALLQVLRLLAVDRLPHDHRRRRIAAPLLQLGDHLVDGHVDDPGKAAELVQPRRPLLGKIGRPELDRGGRAVVHDRPALTVEDRPPLSLERNRTELVVQCGIQVLRARENL